jgi:hypothetical protein
VQARGAGAACRVDEGPQLPIERRSAKANAAAIEAQAAALEGDREFVMAAGESG